eukprot:scaffold219905_cov30-Prasinocladus_malaysianus.AAC.1
MRPVKGSSERWACWRLSDEDQSCLVQYLLVALKPTVTDSADGRPPLPDDRTQQRTENRASVFSRPAKHTDCIISDILLEGSLPSSQTVLG